MHFGALSGTAADRHREGFQERMLGADARDLLAVGREKASASLREFDETGPAGAAAPQRRGAAVEHHRGAVSRMVEIDRVKILVLVETQPVEDVAREDHQPGPARAERDRLAEEVADRPSRTVAADREHS